MQIIETKEAFKALIENIKMNTPNYKDPLAFGICKVVLDKTDANKTPKVTYLIVNSNENFASGAIFIKALSEQEVEVDFNESEVVCDITASFLKSCLNAYNPHCDEAYGDSHKNIQTILTLYKQHLDFGSLDGIYRVVFIFKDAPLKSVEASLLKLSIDKAVKIQS